MKDTTFIITCEHCGNEVPKDYKHIFSNHRQLLSTHRGYDLGASSVACRFAITFNVELLKTPFTRLLVDVNRSLWRRTLFSEITKSLPKNEKEKILRKYYYPHREKISENINKKLSGGKKIIHIAIHSFTPILNSRIRNADLGFLYDPASKNEKEFSRIWKKQMAGLLPGWRLRFNYPYRGKPDGLTAHFRKLYPDKNYLGIELEMNQRFVDRDGVFPEDICNKIVDSFRFAISKFVWL